MRRNRDFIGPAGMGGTVALWGASSIIQSVQEFTVSLGTTTSGTATIAAVDTTRAVLFYRGSYNNNTGTSGVLYVNATGELTNATTVTCNRNSAAGVNMVAAFYVIEFMPGVLKNIQRGRLTLSNGSAIATTAVSTYNANKSFIPWTGMYAENVSPDDANYAMTYFNNSTSIGFTRTGNTNAMKVEYQLVEFF